jgi:hypothetical protein
MFFSIYQISDSIQELKKFNSFFGISFLAFKRFSLPVGINTPVNMTQVFESLMIDYYKPYKGIDAFFSPFYSSKSKEIKKGWISNRYASTTLQRITADTFGKAFIHEKGQSSWGWNNHYIDVLKDYLGGNLIPIFDLSVWLYRDHEWPNDITHLDVIDKFLDDFNINSREQDLFSFSENILDWVSDNPVSESELSEIIGYPDGNYVPETKELKYIELSYVGPAADALRYEPASRMNIVTGDNGLGKTFIFDSIWWAISYNWIDAIALPNNNANKLSPKIECGFNLTNNQILKEIFRYDWSLQQWNPQLSSKYMPAMVIYAKHDGSFAIWDGVKHGMEVGYGRHGTYLSPAQVWNGVQDTSRNGSWLCNGLIIDWSNWQNNSKHSKLFQMLIDCLKILSPDKKQIIIPGKNAVRIPNDSRDIPTIKLSYGDVPILHCSAGLKRILSILYVLLWSWNEFQTYSNARRVEQSCRQILIMVDEIETHLHPKWQRGIIPSILKVLELIGIKDEFQIHISTHSSLILSSVESYFNNESDQLHVFSQKNKDVFIDKMPFIKRGFADLWLMSDIFENQSPRSIESEEIVNEARGLQMSNNPSPREVQIVHRRLVRTLPEDDSFWPLWLYFAKQHGVT